MKLDLADAIQEVINEINTITLHPLDFVALQNLSRNEHYLVLLQSLDNQILNRENILKCFETYYDKTHGSSSFITAHADSPMSHKFYDLVLFIGEKYKISPAALIFPNLEITDADAMYELYNYEAWQQYQQDNEKTPPKTLLSTLVDLYLCGEKTIVYKTNVVDYLCSPFKNEPKLQEVGSLNKENHKVAVSDNYKRRIEQSINSEALRAYRLTIQPDYNPTFKGALNRLSDRLYTSGVNSTSGSEKIAAPDAAWALFDFHPILAKYEPLYKEQCGEDKKLLDFLDFVSTKDPKNGLADVSCVDLKAGKIKDFVRDYRVFLEGLDPSSMNLEAQKALEQERYHQEIKEHSASELLREVALPLDLTSLKDNKLELTTVLQYAELISLDSLDSYLKKNPDALAHTKKITEETEEQIHHALLLYPRHFILMLQSISPEDRNKIINILYELKVTPTILNMISDAHTPDENKRAIFSLLTSLTKELSDFERISSNLPYKEWKIYSNLMMNQLIIWTTSCGNFVTICHGLTLDEKQIYSNLMKPQWVPWTQKSRDFDIMMNALSKDEKPIYLNLTRKQWPNWTEHTTDFKSIFATLPTNERPGYMKSISKQWLNWIENGDVNDFSNIYAVLPEYFDLIKHKFVQLTKNEQDIRRLYGVLSQFDWSIYCDLVKEHLLNLTTNASLFNTIYGRLPGHEKSIYLNKIRKQLPSLTISIDAFFLILRVLPETERSSYCNLVGNQLLAFIKNKVADEADLQYVLEYLIQNNNYETAKKIIEFLKDNDYLEKSVAQQLTNRPDSLLYEEIDSKIHKYFKPFLQKTTAYLKAAAPSNQEAKKFETWVQQYASLDDLNENDMQYILEEAIKKENYKTAREIIKFLEDKKSIKPSFFQQLKNIPFCTKKTKTYKYFKPFSQETRDCLKTAAHLNPEANKFKIWVQPYASLNNLNEVEAQETFALSH